MPLDAPRHSFRLRWTWVVAVVAVAAAVAATVRGAHPNWNSLSGRFNSESDLRALIAAVTDDRVIEARLSGGFTYAARSVVRSGSDSSSNLALLVAAASIRKRAEEHPSPSGLRAAGVGQLLLGKFDPAIKSLEAAISASPMDADYRSDLAAAHIARAETRASRLEDLSQAIESAERSLALDPTLREAQFNRALALQLAGLREQSVIAWSGYLTTDPSSGWSTEGRARVAALRSDSYGRSECLELQGGPRERLIASATRCPQQVRELGEQLLDEWAKKTLAGESQAARDRLALVEQIANALASGTGDRLLHDSFRSIAVHPQGRRALAQGHDALARGRALYASDQRHLALDEFLRARTLLKSAGSPYWLVAQQNIATVHTHKRELREASELLGEVSRVAAANGYRALQARVEWLRGVVTLQMSDPAGALDAYQQAMTLFAALGEKGNLSNVANAAADTERILGDFQRGWRSLLAALANLADVGDPTRRYLAFYNGALYAHREQLEFAALHFQNEALAAARARRGPAGVIEGSINKAAILGRLQKSGDALKVLDEAVSMIPSLEDPQQRAYMTARVAAARGELLITGDPNAAVVQLGTAARHFSVAEPAEMPRLWLLQGQALGQSDRVEQAAQAYVAGIESFESRLGNLREDEQRVSYSDEGWELYRRMVELRLNQRNFNEALTFANRGRARTGPQSIAPSSPERICAALSPDRMIVFYTVLNTEAHAWTFAANGVEHRRIAIGEAAIDRMAAQAAQMIPRKDEAALNRTLAALYTAVISPLAIPDGIREVVFIPDGALRMVPFAALRDSRGHFLAEKWATVIADSLESVSTSRAVARLSRSEVVALVVGSPLFDVERSPQLAPLPFAAREAATVSALYRGSTLLTGAAATKTSILKLLPSVDVFHFAGHAVANDEFPELSRLLLTPGDRDAGELLAQDLHGDRLRARSVVVLSACQTAAGLMRRAAGIQSLARAFLRVGAGTVVAASWDVEDLDTSELMTVFHEHLSKGDTAAESLRAAQVKLIAAGRPVSAWAAFVPFAGALSN